ncbi:Ig-like domain-containing protein [Anaeromyxobacter soli]|uniref:Ig-like domain-containing protein n=1 Tax=Anaeromyxobacter soli TaxID=2922725 RepID=UPI001FAF80C8|nr:Ig-like domain-containing protein [Anaeromyxobacter sp. SG29]
MSRHSTVSLTAALALALAAGGGCSSRGRSSEAAPAGAERIARVEQPIPDQYLVVLAAGDGAADVAAVAASVANDHGATVLNVYQHALRGFSMRAGLAAAGAVALDPRVERVEQDGVARAAAVAWQYGPTWGLDRVDQRGAALDDRYGWDDRWTGVGVDAFVLDTGVLTSHAAFGGRASFAFDALGEGVVGDCSGHGTHVAGTIAGGPYGVAKGASIRSVRVLDCSGNGSASSVVAGLDWVIANHSRPSVANLSLFASPSSAIDAAVEAATASGIVVVVAAGDGGKDACDVSPARAPGALTVAALQQRTPPVVGGAPVDELAPFSNVGDCVDFVAPGAGIVSAWNTTAVADLPLSGTSMAAPHVTGAVALLLSRNPAATPQDVVRVLVASATRAPAGAPGFTPDRLVYTRGVELTPTADDAAPTVAVTAPVEGDALTGAVNVTGTASDDHGLTRIELLVDGRWRGSSDSSSFEIAWDTSTSLDGAHSLVVRAYDSAGHATDSTAISVTVSNPGVAHLDPGLRIARCETLAASCDSRDLVRGRAALGPERYAPSVLRDGCDADPAGCVCHDGELGVYQLDESIEQLRISSDDGKPLVVGGNVKLEVDAIVGGELGDSLDLYASPAVSPPSWRHLITLTPVASGPQTLTAWYTLSAGGTQAVRAAFRRGGDAAAVCTSGGFDDRDDLVFEVGGGTADGAPPTVEIVAPAAGGVLAESTTVEVAAADDRLVSKVMVTADDWKGKTYAIAQLTATPYTAAWNPALLPNGEYVLRAVAHDGAGNIATDEVAVTLADLTGPTVAILEPLDAASLPSNLIEVAASATDAGAVAKVDLFLDGVFQGSDVVAPWGFELRAPANGTYALRVRGTDLQGNVTESAPVTLTVNDVTPPDVKVLAPEEGAVVPNAVTFSVDPTDDSGIRKVEFFLDGVSLGTNTGAPWEIPYDFSRAPNGSYVFSASAYDGVGNVGTASVTVRREDLTPPTVSVTSPPSGSYLSGEVQLTADAADDSSVKRVEFWLHVPYTTYGFKVGETTSGAPWTFTLASSTVPSGTYLLYAKAFDFGGNVGDSKSEPLVWVRTGDITPPTTTLRAPVSGLAQVAGTIRVAADAADPGGELAKVELRVDDVPFATFTAAPFEATLDTTSVANGDHVLTSKAYDTAGNTAVSDPVTMNVQNPGAAFDPVAGAPSCDVVSPFCHTGILLMGRGPLGPEANASNTVDGCPDGTEGVYRSDESIEHVAISSLDGAPLTGGKLARVEVRAFVADPVYDRLDVYVAADAAAPQFVLRATVEPTLTGEQILSATVPLAYSERQVVRVALRGGGLPEACGTTGYDDRDDVVIATEPGTPDTTPPSVSISAPTAGAKVRDAVAVSAAASDDVGVEHVDFEVDGGALSSDGSAPFTASWDTTGLAPGTYSLTAVAFDYSGNWTRSAPVSVEVEDVVKPTATITAPVDGETASGAITVQVAATDNVAVTEVKLVRLDAAGVETLVATDTAAPWAFPTSLAGLADGADYRFVARAYDAGKNVGESAPVTVHVAQTGLASFDRKLKAPKCALAGASCWTGGLVVGRGPLGPEPSAPNTIAASCPDGGSGFFHQDESVDVVTVRALDPVAGLKEGGAVRIEAKVWATASYVTDALDVYVAPNALSPSWRWVATLTPTRAGLQVLGVDHVLEPGALQAVRVQLRHAGTQQPCSTGEFDDHDDLAFAVSK